MDACRLSLILSITLPLMGLAVVLILMWYSWTLMRAIPFPWVLATRGGRILVMSREMRGADTELLELLSCTFARSHRACVLNVAPQTYVAHPNPIGKFAKLWLLRQHSASSFLHDFQNAFEAYPMPFMITAKDGQILFANAPLTKWLGYTKESLYGQPLGMLLEHPPQSLEEFQTQKLYIKNAHNRAIPAHMAHVGLFNQMDLACFFFSPAELSFFLRDIADPELLEILPMPAAFLDEQGDIRAINTLMRTQIGIAESAPLSLGQWLSEKDRSAFVHALKKARKTYEIQGPMPLSLRMCEKAPMIGFLRYYDAHDGCVPGQFLVVFSEVGEAQGALPHTLKDSDPHKMQLLGQLAGGIVHDFNNLLTGILGFCDLLLQRHTKEEGSHKDIMQIKQSAVRASRLIQQLLAFSKSTPPSLAPINVKECLQELSPLIRKMIGPQVLLKVQQTTPLKYVMGDSNQLEQVLLNLAINARDAMSKGGTLTFGLRSVTVRNPLQTIRGTLAPQNYILVEVSDTGEGIAEENLSRIFDPFFSTKDPGQGTGLGLANVLQIMQGFGGGITVKTRMKKGTTFALYFPEHEKVACPQKVLPNTLEKAIPEAVHSKILLVEDEDAVRLFASRALKDLGFEVVEARDGYQAMALLKQHKNIALVITDVMMPGVDGPALAVAVRKAIPNARILFVSGYPEDEVRPQLPESTSSVFFLQKPFTLTDLVTEVRRLAQEEKVTPSP